MSVGSPALAAYSLVLTALNARSVHRRVDRIKYENKATVARALISLQQIPLELTKKELFLSSISIHGQWEQEIVDRLGRRNAWSLATASSVAWVVIAFLFTLIDAFIFLSNPLNTVDNSIAGKSTGHAVGTLWLWLLCLVTGWMWVPAFTRGQLESALEHANRRAAEDAAKRVRRARQRATQVMSPADSKVVEKPSERVEVSTQSVEPVVGAVEEDKVVEEGLDEEVDHVGQNTDQKADSLLNMTAGSPQLSSEGQRSDDHFDNSKGQTSSQCSADGDQPVEGTSYLIQPGVDELLISKDPSPLNRDEFRRTVTFNYTRVIRFLVLVEEVSRMFGQLSGEQYAVGASKKH